jgi:hypothetical protein
LPSNLLALRDNLVLNTGYQIVRISSKYPEDLREREALVIFSGGNLDVDANNGKRYYSLACSPDVVAGTTAGTDWILIMAV